MMVSCVASMPMPPKYAAWLQSLGFTEISFGYAGIKLLLPEEFDDGRPATRSRLRANRFAMVKKAAGKPSGW